MKTVYPVWAMVGYLQCGHCMKSIHKSVVVNYSPAEMFQLVSDVPAYSQFLPWCDFSRVLQTTPEGKIAEVGIGLCAVRQSFTTRNVEQPGKQIDMHLVRGPFSQLSGQWRFAPVGDDNARACRIDFQLRYSFANLLLARLVGPLFDKIASNMVDAFIQRAKKVYG